jgi:hypothetical protein
MTATYVAIGLSLVGIAFLFALAICGAAAKDKHTYSESGQ